MLKTPISSARLRACPGPANGDESRSVDVSNISVSWANDTIQLTPVSSRANPGSSISRMKNLLEQQMKNDLLEVEDKSSPGLTRLRMTPGGTLKEKQKSLMKKHEDTRHHADTLNVGGGVSLWPEMEDMRLKQGETIKLGLISATLFIAVVGIFSKLHGNLLRKMRQSSAELREFISLHPIIHTNEETFHLSLMDWHVAYRKLLSEIKRSFDISHVSVSYHLYVLTYIAGVLVLMYILIENMFSKNKLSPRRIKIWVSLLTVVGTWTVLMVVLLVTAQQLEFSVEQNIHHLGEVLGDAIETNLDMHRFHVMLSYWRTRCLPPTTAGVLTILNMLPVRDVAYYLQYYSLPVIMALVTPVVKLILALHHIYRVEQ